MTRAPEPWPIVLMSRSLGLGGSERQLAAIAKALDRGRFAPRVVCFRREGLRVAELERDGVPVIEFPVRSFRSPATAAVAGRFVRYVRRERIRLVHAFDYPANFFLAPLAPLLGPALALTSQRSHRSLIPGLMRRLMRCTDRAADAVVVNCEWVRRHLIQDEGVPRQRIELCYNGLDCGEFHPAEQDRPPALAGASAVIGVVCALRPEKDLGTLLAAFAAMRGIQDGLRLAIVGDGPCQEPLRAQAARLGIAAQVCFSGGTTEVARWLRAIDIFVLPSLSEALSNALMEAMACGCCAVASNVGGNPELVTNNVTGLLFEPGDAVMLAGILRRLIEDTALRARLSAAAAQSIPGRFGLEQAARNMGAIYARLLASH